MIGLIAIALLFAWVMLVFGLTKVLFNLKKWKNRKALFWLTTVMVTLLPFAEEIYIVGSFYSHCAIYGGVSKLEPVETDRLTIRYGAVPVGLLAHPAINAVWLSGNQDPQFGPKEYWISITDDQQSCKDPINERLTNGRMRVTASRAKKLISQGKCFSTASLIGKPSIELTKTQSIFHKSYSLLLPYGVSETRRSLLDISTATPRVLSVFTRLSIEPGTLRRAMWPQYSKYKCSAPRNSKSNVFPFGLRFYEFLEDAIIKGDK